MRIRLVLAVAGMALVSAAAPARAHHSFASEFDAKKPDGTVENWMIEAGSPNSLFRRGVNKNTVRVGMQVLIDGYQARDGSLRANGRDVTLPDGGKLFLGSQGTGAPPGDQK